MRQLQEAVCNYMTVQHLLWPFDHGPHVILRVLIECRWGEAAGNDMKERVNLVSRFFNEVVSDNSGRAVRGEPPLDYEKVRAKWARVIETSFPQLSFLGASGSGSTGGAGQPKQQGKNSRDGKAQGGGDNRAAGPPRAVHNGRLVCFSFNQRDGCKRPRGAYDACKDANGRLYAHYCNHYDKGRRAHCLAMHPRSANH